MPNYFVTNTARFNPFTYQELYKTAADITQQHYALEEALANMDDGTLSTYLAGEDRESPYVIGYKDLTGRIKTLSEQLAANGINANLMKDALRLKGDFKKFSTPVEAAGKRKQQLSDEYRKLQLSVPYLMGENPSEKPLQFYIDNPNYVPTYDNGEAYIKQGTLIGSQLADQLRNPDAPYTIAPGSGGQLLRAVFRRGYSPEEIANDPMFVNVTNQILESRGLDPESKDARTNTARAYIQQGLYSALGKDDVQERVNQAYLDPLKRLQYDALKNSPADNFSTQIGSQPYKGEGFDFAVKLFGKDKDHPGILKDLSDKNLVDADGNPLNNSLEVQRYLNGLKQSAGLNRTYRMYNPEGNWSTEWGENSGNEPSVSGVRQNEAKNKELYYKEKERLGKYGISDSNYRYIQKNLGLKDNFTYDDIEKAISEDPMKYSAGQLGLYGIANAATSKEQLDVLMNYIGQNIATYSMSADEGRRSKGVFYSTDGARTGEALTINEVNKMLYDKDTVVYGANATKPLADRGYFYVATNKGNVAVPISFMLHAGLPLQETTRLMRELGLNPYDFTDTRSDIMLDAAVRAGNQWTMDQKVAEVSPSKGRR